MLGTEKLYTAAQTRALDHCAIHDQPEIQCAEAHESPRDPRLHHEVEGEEHRERDGRRDDKRGPQVTEE